MKEIFLITIFSAAQVPQSYRWRSGFALSLVLHCAVVLFVVFGYLYSQTDSSRRRVHKYTVQFVRLDFSPPARLTQPSKHADNLTAKSRSLRMPRPARIRNVNQTLV